MDPSEVHQRGWLIKHHRLRVSGPPSTRANFKAFDHGKTQENRAYRGDLGHRDRHTHERRVSGTETESSIRYTTETPATMFVAGGGPRGTGIIVLVSLTRFRH